MTNLVRVQLENGSKASVSEATAEIAGLTPLDEPATDKRGRALPAEFPENAPEGYGSLPNDRLRELIDERNEGREDSDKLPKSGNKDALVAVLEADDQMNTPSS